LPAAKLGGRYSLAVEFDNNAARQEIPAYKELLKRAGDARFNLLAVRYNGSIAHLIPKETAI
jgi:hypothetical protein